MLTADPDTTKTGTAGGICIEAAFPDSSVVTACNIPGSNLIMVLVPVGATSANAVYAGEIDGFAHLTMDAFAIGLISWSRVYWALCLVASSGAEGA